jgi:proline iminopeptidase
MPPIPPPRAQGFTTSTPVPLYWVEYGDPAAPPILLLHGGPGASHDYLLPQMLVLAEEHRLVTYDQRGGGRSRHDDDRAVIGWRDQVEDVARVAAELRVSPLTIVGYSWGGLLAMLYAVEASSGAFSRRRRDWRSSTRHRSLGQRGRPSSSSSRAGRPARKSPR